MNQITYKEQNRIGPLELSLSRTYTATTTPSCNFSARSLYSILTNTSTPTKVQQTHSGLTKHPAPSFLHPATVTALVRSLQPSPAPFLPSAAAAVQFRVDSPPALLIDGHDLGCLQDILDALIETKQQVPVAVEVPKPPAPEADESEWLRMFRAKHNLGNKTKGVGMQLTLISRNCDVLNYTVDL